MCVDEVEDDDGGDEAGIAADGTRMCQSSRARQIVLLVPSPLSSSILTPLLSLPVAVVLIPPPFTPLPLPPLTPSIFFSAFPSSDNPPGPVSSLLPLFSPESDISNPWPCPDSCPGPSPCPFAFARRRSASRELALVFSASSSLSCSAMAIWA